MLAVVGPRAGRCGHARHAHNQSSRKAVDGSGAVPASLRETSARLEKRIEGDLMSLKKSPADVGTVT